MNILLIIFWGLLIPFILGYQFDVLFSKDRISYARCLLFGYVICFASFQLIAPEFVIAGGKFTTLFYLWIAVIVILVISTLLLNREAFFGRVVEPFKTISNDIKSNNTTLVKYILMKHDGLELLVFAGAVFFIVFHTILIGYMMHFDTDDARFVAEALEAYEKNTLFVYHPITGAYLGGPIGEMAKDVFAPYPLFMAVYGKLFGVTPAVATHTILPFLYVPMSYMAFYLLAKKIFKEDNKSVIIAVFLFSVINTFSMESIFSYGWVLLTLIWQGRSFLCTVLIPFMVYILMHFIVEFEIKKIWYVAMSLCGVAGCMLSGMGAMLIPPMVLSFGLIVFIVKRNIRTVMYMFAALIPTLVYFILYSTYSGKI